MTNRVRSVIGLIVTLGYNHIMLVNGAETLPVWFLWVVLPLAVWDLAWRGMALWHAAKNEQKNWFIALMIVNSVGILPIIYLKFFRKKI